MSATAELELASLPAASVVVVPTWRTRWASHFFWWRNSYLFDWALLFAVCILELTITHLAFSPYDRYLPHPQDVSLTYPYANPATVPAQYLGFVIPAPIVIFAFCQLFMRSTHDFHHACLGLAESVVFTLIFTDVTKVACGRYRPDWYSREHLSAAIKLDGRQSFPSGHSSLSFTAMVFLSLYMSGKLGVFRDNGGAVWKACLSMSPIAISTFIAITRVRNYRHHFSDILAGSVLGTCIAIFAYILNYYSLTSNASHLPKLRTVRQAIVYYDANYPTTFAIKDETPYSPFAPRHIAHLSTNAFTHRHTGGGSGIVSMDDQV
eukprot:TRINITY_DN4468_c1_g2_i1.p1 TRINITY_DN4468_c1_g2~~TRINITY_DN4468_c1_g2_i1.p1  ORF type:complete len:329 (-),score=41.94 TRINITY_DN4468_c1_g2_i1:4-966(-)